MKIQMQNTFSKDFGIEQCEHGIVPRGYAEHINLSMTGKDWFLFFFVYLRSSVIKAYAGTMFIVSSV